MSISFRRGKNSDSAIIFRFLKELAELEGKGADFALTEAVVRERLLQNHSLSVLLAADSGTPVGLAVYFERFSGLTGSMGLWLLDLYIVETHRRRGVGRLMIERLKEEAKSRDCGVMEWFVSRRNNDAKAFYRKLSACHDPSVERWKLKIG